MIQFQENTRTDSTIKGWTPLFIGPFWLLPEVPTSTTAVDQHLKVKDIEYDVDLTKNYYIKVSMQKISSNHKLIPIIRQILGSHELNGHAHPRIIEITFSFPEFAPACKKSFHFINSFLRYSHFQSPMTKLRTPISDHAHSKNFD